MFDRCRAGVASSLFTLVLLLGGAGCSNSDPKPDSKEGSPRTNTTTDTNAKPAVVAPPDTLVPLLETLPKEKWPSGNVNAAGLTDAAKWLTENLTGKRATVTSSLSEITILLPSKKGESTRVTLKNGPNKGEPRFLVIRGKGDIDKVEAGLRVWGQEWSVELRQPDPTDESRKIGINLSPDPAEVKRLRSLETKPGGHDVKLSVTIENVQLTAGIISITVKDVVVEPDGTAAAG